MSLIDDRAKRIKRLAAILEEADARVKDPIGEVEALGWTIDDVQDDPQTPRDEARRYIAVVRNDKGKEVERVEVYSAQKLLGAVVRHELFPGASLKAWRKREAWQERSPPEP